MNPDSAEFEDDCKQPSQVSGGADLGQRREQQLSNKAYDLPYNPAGQSHARWQKEKSYV